MGNYFDPTFSKCVIGIAAADVQKRTLSPSAQENCAVALREAETMTQEQNSRSKSSKPNPATSPQVGSRIYSDMKKIISGKSAPKAKLEILEKFLDHLSTEQKLQVLKQVTPQIPKN